jgi:hypothetical protein
MQSSGSIPENWDEMCTQSMWEWKRGQDWIMALQEDTPCPWSLPWDVDRHAMQQHCSSFHLSFVRGEAGSLVASACTRTWWLRFHYSLSVVGDRWIEANRDHTNQFSVALEFSRGVLFLFLLYSLQLMCRGPCPSNTPPTTYSLIIDPLLIMTTYPRSAVRTSYSCTNPS